MSVNFPAKVPLAEAKVQKSVAKVQNEVGLKAANNSDEEKFLDSARALCLGMDKIKGLSNDALGKQAESVDTAINEVRADGAPKSDSVKDVLNALQTTERLLSQELATRAAGRNPGIAVKSFSESINEMRSAVTDAGKKLADYENAKKDGLSDNDLVSYYKMFRNMKVDLIGHVPMTAAHQVHEPYNAVCRQTDRAIDELAADLRSRGLLVKQNNKFVLLEPGKAQ